MLVDLATYRRLAFGMMVLGVLTALSLLFVVAPYGRHLRGGWGPTIPNRLGWLIMESPSLVYFSWVYWHGAHCTDVVPLVLYALWIAHYGHRTLVYPLRIRSRGKRMPLAIAILAIAFNALNSTLNARWISDLGSYSPTWLASPMFVLGAALFGVGMLTNLDSDRRLFALRRPGERGYAIPRGGLYTWVSNPNYLGEIVEWAGWALASASLGGLAFLLYSIANLAPRAWSNHAWYRTTFADYPRERRALVPFVW